MIRMKQIVAKPSVLAEKLNQEGLKKQDIVQILAERWDARYLYTVIYEVADEQE